MITIEQARAAKKLAEKYIGRNDSIGLIKIGNDYAVQITQRSRILSLPTEINDVEIWIRIDEPVKKRYIFDYTNIALIIAFVILAVCSV